MNEKSIEPREILLRPDVLADPTRGDLVIIEATMLWPKAQDAHSRSGAINAGLVEFIAPAFHELDDDAKRDAFERARLAPQLGDLQQQAKEQFVKGAIVGRVLREIVALIEIGRTNTSIGDVAMRAVEPFSKEWRISKKSFDNRIWPEFRSVAHFWAAYMELSFAGQSVFPCSYRRIGDFLATAEYFRVKGESLRTKQSPKSSILCAGEAIRIPAYLGIKAADLHFELI